MPHEGDNPADKFNKFQRAILFEGLPLYFIQMDADGGLSQWTGLPPLCGTGFQESPGSENAWAVLCLLCRMVDGLS